MKALSLAKLSVAGAAMAFSTAACQPSYYDGPRARGYNQGYYAPPQQYYYQQPAPRYYAPQPRPAVTFSYTTGYSPRGYYY